MKTSTYITAVFITLVQLISASVFGQHGALTLIGQYHSETEIVHLYDSLKKPVLVFNNNLFTVSDVCIVRHLGGEDNNRKVGGDDDNRKLGGDNDKRKTGGDSDNRKMGGDNDNRKIGGDNDSRKMGGDNDNRKVGGDSDNRKMGGDNDSRKTGGDSDNRKMGGDDDHRKIGGDNDNRKVGGDNDRRKMGGDDQDISCDVGRKGELILHLPSNQPTKNVKLYMDRTFLEPKDNFFTIK